LTEKDINLLLTRELGNVSVKTMDL